ncbi:hypothetical protein VCR31J2_1360076 [Vibrio coralliirubri]|uniref:Uncharacterized protein n=1 Tax=Vibrio coralliirubri TaxID=1516159 RepID=A0AA86XSM6_9VIBR|nr:hypothetical protein VCR31J2_1360076 [Vibrio coralliirubri]
MTFNQESPSVIALQALGYIAVEMLTLGTDVTFSLSEMMSMTHISSLQPYVYLID